MGVAAVEGVEPFKAGKEGPPTSCKVPTTLEPEALYSGVVCGPANAFSRLLGYWGLAAVSRLRSPHEGGAVWAPVHDHPCAHIHILGPTVGANPGRTSKRFNGLQE